MEKQEKTTPQVEIDKYLDATGMRCPIPVLRAGKEIKAMKSGEVLEITASDAQAPRDFRDFCEASGHELLLNEERDGKYLIILKKG
ncbi:MAG: sulfurtransferase TusA family protein [Terasakiella sp.]|uniref:sulfurtransferase TusA family protein n=1 Tax=unclassified Terasakiella TaxID=2614952 RepID=UPI003B009BA7